MYTDSLAAVLGFCRIKAAFTAWTLSGFAGD